MIPCEIDSRTKVPFQAFRAHGPQATESGEAEVRGDLSMIRIPKNLLASSALLALSVGWTAAADAWATNFIAFGHDSNNVRLAAKASLDQQPLPIMIGQLKEFLSERKPDKSVVWCLDYLVKRDAASITQLHNAIRDIQSTKVIGVYLSWIHPTNTSPEILADVSEWLQHTSAVVRVRSTALLHEIFSEKDLITVLIDACDSEEFEFAGDPPDRAGQIAKELLLGFRDRGSVMECLLDTRPRGKRHKYQLLDVSARLYGITQRFLYSHIGDPLKEEMEALDAIDRLIIQRRNTLRD